MHFIVTPAGQAPDLARALYEGQRAALRAYGLEQVAKPAAQSDAYLVAAEVERGVPVGGLCLQQRLPGRRLPLEESIDLPPSVTRNLERVEPGGLVELCALWVAPTEREPRLADRLVCLGLEAAAAAGMRHVVALGGQYSLPLALRTGFHLAGGEPAYSYPDARYRSRMVWKRLPSAAGFLHRSTRRS